MPRSDRLSMFATTISGDKTGATTVRYHATDIVRFDAQEIRLATGGYRTVTTKRKMNQTALQFGLPFGVAQRKGEWFIAKRGPRGEWLSETEIQWDSEVATLDRTTGELRAQ